jgi:hypothetical protein
MSRIVLCLLIALPLAGQELDPIRNVSGTTANPAFDPWIRSTSGVWTFFHGFDGHLTFLTQTGPEEQENTTFSTNWIGAGLHRPLGARGFILLRGRASFEPYTIDEEGYPQFFQYSERGDGAPLQDRMRPHDLFGEAAVQVGWRPSRGTLVHVYGALVGQPALGPPPAQLRASGIDFAEAPFAYDIQETTHDSGRVITAGFETERIAIEASVFHDAVTIGDHTGLPDGDIDSHSARVTFRPQERWSFQVSRGELGETIAQRTVTSASVSYTGGLVSTTALWTRREHESARAAETAYALEIALHASRSTFMGRAEWLDRPGGFPFPDLPIGLTTTRVTHYTAGYLYDFIAGSSYRFGAGVNIDYRTQTHDFEDVYGHKPQGIYTFLRIRTE